MKKLGIIALLLILISLYFLASTTPTLAKPENHHGTIDSSVAKIQQFNRALNTEGVKPDSWSVFIRENAHDVKNIQALEDQVRQVKKDLSSFQWDKFSHLEGFYTLNGALNDPEHGMKVHVTLFAYPHKERYASYLVYEIKGDKWDKGTANSIKRHIATDLSKIQHHEMTFYTCVKAHEGATMNNGLSKSTHGILHALHARPVEEVSEKTFISISAYTDYWKDTLTTGDKLMNVQVAMRQTGETVTLILGSPIITTAY